MSSPAPLDTISVAFEEERAIYPKHPGGQRLLALARGHQRADLLFVAYHLGMDLRVVRAAARRAGIEPRPLDSEFVTKLSGLLREARRPLDEAIFRGYCAFLLAAFPISLLAYVVRLDFVSGAIFAGIIVSYAFTVFHMRHHFGGRILSHGLRGSSAGTRVLRAADAALAPGLDALDEMFFVSIRQWIEQHQRSHHVFTNTREDFDLTKPYPIIRLDPSAAWRPHHRLQTFYAPAAFFLNGLSFALENVLQKGGKGRYLAAHVVLLLVIPGWIHGWAAAGLGYLAVLGVVGLAVSYLFQLSHNFQGVMATPRLDEQLDFRAWVAHQVTETQSYGGYLLTLVVGGINLQTEHHVFPAASPLALYRVKRKFQTLCAQEGFRYTWRPSTVSALISYHQQLFQLGRPPRVAVPGPTS